MMSKSAITRLFLRNGCDIHEIYQQTFLRQVLLGSLAREEAESPGGSEEPVWRDLPHHLNIWLQFLQDQNLDVDYIAADDPVLKPDLTLLQHSIYFQSLGLDKAGMRATEVVFMLCAMGANVSARMPDSGAQPLHLVACTPYSLEGSFYINVQFVILLAFGADPCARDDRGLTITQIACSRGWEEQWFRALCMCNKAQVVVEQMKAQIAGRKDAPLDDAIRTGVDVTDLSTPSIEGLSRRTVARGDRLDD